MMALNRHFQQQQQGQQQQREEHQEQEQQHGIQAFEWAASFVMQACQLLYHPQLEGALLARHADLPRQLVLAFEEVLAHRDYRDESEVSWQWRSASLGAACLSKAAAPPADVTMPAATQLGWDERS
jgi:hypothetical protein